MNLLDDPRYIKCADLVSQICKGAPFEDTEKDVKSRQMWTNYLMNEIEVLKGIDEKNRILGAHVREISEDINVDTEKILQTINDLRSNSELQQRSYALPLVEAIGKTYPKDSGGR